MLIQKFNDKDGTLSRHPRGWNSTLDDKGMQNFLNEIFRKGNNNDLRFNLNNSKDRILINNSTADDGMQRALDTLTALSKEVFRPSYYAIEWANLIPISTEGAYLENMFNYSVVPESTDWASGFYKLSDSIRPTTSDITISSKTITMGAVHRKVNYNIFQQKQGELINFSIIQEMMQAEKEVNDLGIQEFAFLGKYNDSNFQGLLNNSGYSVNTTLLTNFLYQLSDVDFINFATAIIYEYYKQSNFTRLPNRFVIPVEDIQALTMPISTTFPYKTRLELLEQAFQTALLSLGNPRKVVKDGKELVDFEIVATPYASKDKLATRGINQNRYLLYNFSENVAESGLKMHLPLDFVNFGTYTVDGINYQSSYITQMSGVNIYKPKQFLCLAHTA